MAIRQRDVLFGLGVLTIATKEQIVSIESIIDESAYKPEYQFNYDD